jgi:hypothetical protein
MDPNIRGTDFETPPVVYLEVCAFARLALSVGLAADTFQPLARRTELGHKEEPGATAVVVTFA